MCIRDSSLTMPENATVFPRLWRTNVKPSNNGLPSFWPADSPLVAALPRWTPPAGANETLLCTERVTLVRLLGGWSDGGGDFDANATADGGYDADWSALDARVDPIVARGPSPLVVFDNVPWAFAPNASEGDYGNVYGPDDELYGAFEAFARALVARLAARHGAEAAAGWQWRVGTEPNCECHWLDTTRAYLRYYEVCSRAVKDALPRARVGPGNFPKGMRMDMVADINAWLAANATHPPDVLGVSYYGDDANGYRPWEMAESARWMAEGGGPEWPVKFFETHAKVATPLELDRLHEFFDDVLRSRQRARAGRVRHHERVRRPAAGVPRVRRRRRARRARPRAAFGRRAGTDHSGMDYDLSLIHI